MIDATKKIRVDRTLNTSNINDYSARYILSASYGSAGYNSGTGVFSIPKYTSQLDNDSGFITEGYYTSGVGIQISAGGSISSTVPFYSDELARLAISAGVGISYDSTTGVISTTGGGTVGGGVTVSNYVVKYKISSQQSLTSGTDTTIAYNSSVFDPQSWFNTGTSQFKPTIAGYYSVSHTVWFSTGTVIAGYQYNVQIRKNGTSLSISQQPEIGSTGQSLTVADMIYLNGTTDYLTFTAYANGTGITALAGDGTYFKAALVSSSTVGGTSNFSGSYLDLTDKPSLSTVATTGSYLDLTNKPTLFSGSYVDLTNKPTLFSGSYADLTNKPTLFSGSYNDLTNKPTIPTNTSELMNGAGFITSSALNGYATETFVNSAVSNLVASAPAALNTLNELATALGNDANYSTTISTALGNRLRVDVNTQALTTTQKSNAATNLGLATVATSGSYNDLTNKPIIPTSNSQLTNDAGYITSSDITGKQDTLVSGTSIKTINGISILGNGNISLSSGGLTLASFTAGVGISYDNGTGVISSSITQYTDSLARTAISFVAGSGAYNSSTGVITIPTNTNHLTNGAGFITASAISGKQDTLVSGTSIKTINGTSILGSGNISVTGGSGVSLPDQTGNAGKHLTTDGSNLSWVTPTTSPAGTINFDFGNFNKTFTDPISYLLDTVGMDFGVFTQTENLPVDLGTI